MMSSISKDVDKEILASLKASPLPGTVVSVIRPYEVEDILHRCYGVANFKENSLLESRPVSPSTIFPIGSLTKNFTALGLMHLVEEGKLDLDAPVTQYLPFLKLKDHSDNRISARHLLTHTSGIREFRNYFDALRALTPFSSSDKNSLKEYYTGVAIQPIGTPGQIYYKSHHNFGLVACLIEETAQMPLRDFLRQRIFDPLNMKMTDMGLRDDMAEHLSDAFMLLRSGYHAKRKAVSAVAGASGGFSTAEDMSKYLRALLYPEKSGGVVTTSILDQMLKPQYRVNEHLAGQAISFNVDRVQFKHSGGHSDLSEDVAYLTCGQGMDWSGYQTAIVFSREMRVGTCVLSNAGSYTYEASDLASRAFKVAIPSGWTMTQADPKQGVLKDAMGLTKIGVQSPQVWPDIVGNYQVPPSQLLSARLLWILGGEVQIYQEKGKLFLRSLWGPMRANLTRRGPGVPISPISETNPYHFKVVSNKLALSTPVRGETCMTFDPITKKLHIGLISLEKRPFLLSLRLPVMSGIAYFCRWKIGKGKAFDIVTSLFLI